MKLLTVCLSLSLFTVAAVATDDAHLTALAALGAIWPTPTRPRTHISSSFGPRILVSGPRYDFHRGIDISAPTPGPTISTPVHAVLAGQLYAAQNSVGGGLTIIIEHQVAIPFHGFLCNTLSTYYMHLDRFADRLRNAPRGTAIAEGEVIGFVGRTGAAYYPHLHFEVRLCSRCSREYQVLNPHMQCATFGHDPHVHPLVLFQKPLLESEFLSLRTLHQLSGTTDGAVLVTAPDSWPLANRYELHIERTSGTVEIAAVLDLTLRIGFEFQTVAQLDRQEKSRPYLEPQQFGDLSSVWTIEYRIPKHFITKAVGDRVKLRVISVFGRAVSGDVADINASW